ncbi:MAG: hypothetical protein JO368_00850, partial [Acidimicrobiales bacterium]|nr:hypothetical protein [Acidimicrobiales bacterium]
MNLCTKLLELPPVFTEWQGTISCPDCPHYDGGACGSPTRTERNAACPLNAQPLPLREVAIDPGKPVPKGCSERSDGSRSDALEQAIHDEIVRHTGGRVQKLEVEVKGELVVIRGCTACYYHKQLAI